MRTTVSMNSVIASMTERGFCDVLAESRYIDRLAVDLARQQRELLADGGRVEWVVASSDLGSRGSERLVTVAFELLGEFHAATGDDATVDEDVHVVGLTSSSSRW